MTTYELIKSLPTGWVCGGAARSLILQEPESAVNDIDIYGEHEVDINAVCKYLLSVGYTLNMDTNFSKTYTHPTLPPAQVVHFKKHSSIEQVLQHFDFWCCVFGYDPSTGKRYSSVQAIDEYKRKKLSLLKPSPSPQFFSHLQKYLDRGFTTDDCFWELLIMHLEPKNYDASIKEY